MTILGGGAVGWEAAHTDSGTTTGTYSYTYTNVLSQSYAGSASSALSAQADAMYRGVGKSALVSTGTGTGTYTCTYSCGGNGNGDGGWKPGDVIDMIVGAAQMLDLGDNDDYTPDDAQELLHAPVDNPGGKNDGRDRDDEKCDVGPGVSPTGDAVYLPRERYYDTFEDRYECRATGVYGLLDQSDYNKGRKAPGTNTNSSTKSPGMAEIAHQGHKPANGHLIPAAATGSGIDLRNLVAEYEQTNSPYLNHGVEKEIRNSVKSGKHVEISVIPHYGNSGSGVPTEIEYNYGTVEDGDMKHCVITQSPMGGTTRGSADCPRR
ncbi:DNA/RNA non-specific endonuclease [Streptomyces sp. W16]|uniref:DNA/RNA non-specific endonuclease n=1 Tax=Streptomyces sp. W16 TaxID=3076631 RepID=UPI00295AA60C|nr:DNA/RNA non-specific endonuclease [Streptomyces sp. W16]MDV9170748.1 DNA/RNA non-specific endonuclease [Streptomyces sp. W16]